MPSWAPSSFTLTFADPGEDSGYSHADTIQPAASQARIFPTPMAMLSEEY
jgi:hypothetical protein